jgi:putative membrane protein
MRKTMALLLPVLLASAGCDQLGLGGGSEPANDAAVDAATVARELAAAKAKKLAEETPEQRFASTIASLDAFAMGAGNLAKTRASSPALKKFAKKSFDDHRMSTMYLKLAAATVPGVMPDPSLSPEQQADLDALAAASGPAFDKLYKAKIEATDRKSLETLRAFAKTRKSDLQDFAAYFQPWPRQAIEQISRL